MPRVTSGCLLKAAPQARGRKPLAFGFFSWLKEFVHSGRRCEGLCLETLGFRKGAVGSGDLGRQVGLKLLT